jgi:hypothetical protein
MLNASFCGVDEITGTQAVELQDRAMVLHGNPTTIVMWAYQSNLKKIPAWLRTLEKVTLVNLEFCDVAELKAGAFPATLDFLYIGNQRSGLRLHPDSFEGLPNLLYLDISTNKITEDDMHPGLFDGLTNLGQLFMYGNTEVRNFNAEELFPGGTGLDFLNAKQCGLTAIGGDSGTNLRGMRALNILDLSVNDFADRIEADAFDGLASLRDINLAYCGITSLPAHVFSGELREREGCDLTRVLTTFVSQVCRWSMPTSIQTSYPVSTPRSSFQETAAKTSPLYIWPRTISQGSAATPAPTSEAFRHCGTCICKQTISP